MKPYTLTIVYELFDFAGQQKPSDRAVIRKAFDSLRDFPHKGRILIEKDPSGREHFVYLTGKFAIKFWIDEWEREVKIIDIRFRHP